ncbi:MAG TPA: hypothetical protein VF960_07665 [Chloroflexota bacterium]
MQRSEGVIYESLCEDKRSLWISVSQCAWCNAVKVWRWHIRLPRARKLTFQRSIGLPFGMSISITATHGLCTSCADEIYGKVHRS